MRGRARRAARRPWAAREAARMIAVISQGDEGSTRVTQDRQGRLVSAPGSRNRCASQADSASSILVTRSRSRSSDFVASRAG